MCKLKFFLGSSVMATVGCLPSDRGGLESERIHRKAWSAQLRNFYLGDLL